MPKICCSKCFKEYPNLECRKCKCGGTIFPLKGPEGETYWNENKIIDGFKRFEKENGRFPTAVEVDECNYLPAARSIQRRFDGLMSLRKKFNLGQENYTTGEYRSKVAVEFNDLSRKLENQFGEILISKFGEEFVHREKPVGKSSKIRYDFYVYTRNGKFAVDVFMANGIRNLVGCLNVKLRKYNNAEQVERDNIYLVSLNSDISQQKIDALMENKKNKFPKNIKVLNEKAFIELINTSLKSGRLLPYKLT